MKLTVLQENLQQAIGYIQKAIPARPSLPILSTILFSVTETECTIGATDLYFGAKAKLKATIEKTGTIAIPGKEFREIIFSLPAGEIEMELQDATLTIKSAHTKCSIQCLQAAEYPSFPQITGTTLSLDGHLFESIAQLTLFSASTDQARPLLTGVLFDCNADTTRVVTTDGFRLSVSDFPSLPLETPTLFILSAKAVAEVCRIVGALKSKTVVFTVSESLKQVLISFDGIEMYARVLDGEYPPYQRIIPSLFTTEVVFSSDELAEQVKRATIFSRDASSIVQLHITAEKMSITATSATLGSFSGEVSSAKITGDGGVIAFKSKYLLDFLQAAKDNDVWFGMSDSLKPAMFRAQKLPSYQYIVMPFRVTN